jgi:arylformamidase
MSESASPAANTTPVYRGMDRAALDAAYNNSAAVADSAEWIAKWQRRSAALRALPDVQRDVAYGGRERERLDYLPSGAAAAPLFVFIHGGYWQRNAKETFAFVAQGPRARGVDVATLGYTLAPTARLSDIVAEIRQALYFLQDNADRFGFSRGNIFVGGWSAGGHLAAVVCDHPAVRGALAISGIFDLAPIALTNINDAVRLDRTEIANLSPLYHLRAGIAPQRLVVGGDELSELRRQSTAYADAASRLGLPVTLRVLPGHNHFSILDEFARADGILTDELLDLISKYRR